MTALLGPRHAMAPAHNITERMTILTEVLDVFLQFVLESVRQHFSWAMTPVLALPLEPLEVFLSKP